jgi:hypothetical protein
MASTAIMIGDDSISGSLQGVEIKTFGQMYQGLAPKIRPLNSPIMTVNGKRIDNIKIFDENLSTEVGTGKIEFFPNFEKDELSLGLGEEYKHDTIFKDISTYHPVEYIQSPTPITRLELAFEDEIYPRVFTANSYQNINHYDGVIEPLTIRSRAENSSIDGPYESHGVRGAVSNAGEDVRRRSNLLVDYVYPIDNSVEPYLDEIFDQDTLGMPAPGFFSESSDISPPFEDGSDWQDSADQLEGEIKSALILSTTSIEQMFPRGAVSAACGQIVNLSESPGTDSITYAGMRR